jgi:hypothetical protein
MSFVSRDVLVLRPRNACLGFLRIDQDLINTSGGQAVRSSNPRDGVGVPVLPSLGFLRPHIESRLLAHIRTGAPGQLQSYDRKRAMNPVLDRGAAV